MKKIAIVYYSGTGNTEAMAETVKDALAGKAETGLFTAGEFSQSLLQDYDAVAFGCPAMGDEVLEEDVFEPMFASLETALEGKKTALFGSYGWGDGEWMRNWEDRCRSDGADVVATVICQDAPGDGTKTDLEALASALL